jgi:hypothetical protein
LALGMQDPRDRPASLGTHKTAASQRSHNCPARVGSHISCPAAGLRIIFALPICCWTSVLQLPCGAFCPRGCAPWRLPHMCPSIVLPAGQSCDSGPCSDKDTQESCRAVGDTHYAISRKADRDGGHDPDAGNSARAANTKNIAHIRRHKPTPRNTFAQQRKQKQK